MANLSGVFSTTANAIDRGEIRAEQRPYLGMSQLGHHCSTYLWHSFHWAYEDVITHRLKRLFARGHREEPEIIKELERVGIKCDDTQHEMVAVFGHVKGHNDGTAIGVIEAPKTEHLLEFKTMADKYFKEMCKKGVEKSKPVYYGQCQLYMGELKLTRCLFGAVNKNDDSYYWERIKFDKAYYEDLLRKGESIVMMHSPPGPLYGRTYFECRWCNAKGICHNGEQMAKNCRTCEHSEIALEGEWHCTLPGDPVNIPLDIQRVGCKGYELRT